MSVESQDYKFEVLEYAINECIDRFLPSNSENALSVILHQSNEVVWKVATEIYTKSGHQVDFVFVRDVLNLRIKKIIIEQLKIEEEQIKPDAIFNQDLGADETDNNDIGYNIDQRYIMLAIEIEFDIKIQEKECENLLSWKVGQLVCFVMQKI